MRNNKKIKKYSREKRVSKIFFALILIFSLLITGGVNASVVMAGDDGGTNIKRTGDNSGQENPGEPAEPGEPTEPGEPAEPAEPTEPPKPPVAEKKKISLKGLKKNIRVKARQKFVNNISVTPTNVEKVILQKEDRGKWVNKKNFISDSKGIAKIEYPKEINKKSKSVWRIYIPETKETTGYYSDKIFITVLRTYQTPGKYHKINDQRIVLKGGGYTLRLGYMGLKVRKVNSYFHIGSYHWPRYTATTKMKVRRFQKRHHLKATGNVDKKTWLKMGFSEKSWYQMGAYTSPIGVDLTYTKKQCINAMIRHGMKYLKARARYVVGASGTPKQGCDCSGFIMQCLYSVGINPLPTSAVRHSKPGYEYESRQLFKNRKLKKVKLKNIKRGDLVFCGGGIVTHIAMYIGKGRCIESWPNRVCIMPLRSGIRGRILGVRRPLP